MPLQIDATQATQGHEVTSRNHVEVSQVAEQQISVLVNASGQNQRVSPCDAQGATKERPSIDLGETTPPDPPTPRSARELKQIARGGGASGGSPTSRGVG